MRVWESYSVKNIGFLMRKNAIFSGNWNPNGRVEQNYRML